MEHENYVDYPTAIKLKKAGFHWSCYNFWFKSKGEKPIFGRTQNPEDGNGDNDFDGWNYSAPTLAVAAKWLREAKGLAINVVAHERGSYRWDLVYLPESADYDNHIKYYGNLYDTYERCLCAALDAVLEMIEK